MIKNETVVLVHGLWMNGLDMLFVARRLKRHGYQVSHFRYNSMTRTPRENAAKLHDRVSTLNTPVIHFICHSLGGLVIRHFFYHYPDQKPGRVVTLGTPHRPSYSAYRLSRFPLGDLLLGKSVDDGLLGNVPKWNGSHDLGSIAGTLRLGLGMIIPGVPAPNDGTVSVEETHTENMKDHVTVRASHFGLLLSPAASRLAVEFLQHGKFLSI